MKKNYILVLGVFFAILGVTYSITSLLKENYITLILAGIFALIGIFLVAKAWED